MAKDKLQQSISISQDCYSTSDAFDFSISNEVADYCHKELGSFNSHSFAGKLKDSIKMEDVICELEKWGLKEYGRSVWNSIYDSSILQKVRMSSQMAIVFIDTNGGYDEPNIASNEPNIASNDREAKQSWSVRFAGSKKLCEELITFFKQHFEEVNQERKGIYCMMDTCNGLGIRHIGYPGQPIIPTNYSGPVMKGYDRIVNDFTTDKPTGCLTIISGPPGTGKTFLVRALIDAAEKDVLFVMIPPAIVANLSGPSIIPLLVNIKESYMEDKTGVVFIVEDGDDLLGVRGSDNMPSLSALLNCSDGILGALYDMRFLVTTNAEAQEFDPALMRPGRLSCRLEIGELCKREAIIAYNVITKTEKGAEVIDREMTLAEVYAKVSGNDYVFTADTKGKVGF